MALSIIPLLARMALIHVVLIFGTNNTQTAGITESEIHRRSIGSRLVLGARILYALFIWIAKFTVSEFLKRMTTKFWTRSYEIQLRFIRVFLVVSFIAVMIGTLVECQPFDHYWQVVPDPGPRCRQGYVQLITMGTADMITDLLLIIFPIPIVLKSSMPPKRKFSLVLLFSMSIILFGIAAYRVPAVIKHKGRQQYRTVWASGEILAAAAVSNAVVLGSFLRDRGLKKNKYRYGSTSDSTDHRLSRLPTITQQQWGSDEDLVRELGGYRLDPDLMDDPTPPRPAPVGAPASPTSTDRRPSFTDKNWQLSNKTEESSRTSDDSRANPAPEELPCDDPKDAKIGPAKRTVSFFDVGGLLEQGPGTAMPTTSFAGASSPENFPSSRRGSRALLYDLGGLLSPVRSRHQSGASEGEEIPMSSTPRASHAHQRSDDPPVGISSPTLDGRNSQQSLQDVGGLLDDDSITTYRKASDAQSINPPTTLPSSPSTPRANSTNFSLPWSAQ